MSGQNPVVLKLRLAIGICNVIHVFFPWFVEFFMPFHRSKHAENCPSTVYNHSMSHRQIDAKGFGPQVCMFGGRSRGRCVRSTQL